MAAVSSSVDEGYTEEEFFADLDAAGAELFGDLPEAFSDRVREIANVLWSAQTAGWVADAHG